MKRLLFLLLLLVLAASMLILPSYAASAENDAVTISFGQAEVPENAKAWGAVYGGNNNMLHVEAAASVDSELCISISKACRASMTEAKLFIVDKTTLQPLQQPVVLDASVPAANAVALVVTGSQTTEVFSAAELQAAIDPSGNSVVTLLKDMGSAETPAAHITLPYSCTVDFNGHTITTANASYTSGGNGITISAVGTASDVTTLKNGRLVAGNAAVSIKAGEIVVDNMTIDNYIGAGIYLLETTTREHVIRNSRLSSKGWACLTFNQSGADFSKVTVTIENSSLVSYNTSPIFVRANTKGNVVLGENVELYTYSAAYAASGISVSFETLTQRAKPATLTVNDTSVSGLNHWSTSRTVTDTDVVATVQNGSTAVETTSLDATLSAINSSGNSVVTLYQDIDTHTKSDPMITLPYSCTLDFNGHTIRTADENNDEGDHGISIGAAGSQNSTTTLKNGRLVAYEVGVYASHGAFIVDNMVIDTYYGGTICLYETGAVNHVIKNSTLSSGNWGCFSFNKLSSDFSAATVTVENSTLVAYKMIDHTSTTVFVKQPTAIAGTVILGENVDLYCYNASNVYDEYSDFEGEPLVLQGETAVMTVNGVTCADLNHWSTAKETTSDILATVVTGTKTVNAATLAELLAAIDKTGNSVVTLQKDLDTRALTTKTITLPYTCTLDLNGYTIRTADETTTAGHGIIIAAKGSQNKTTTVKNGHLVAYNFGIVTSQGGLTVDNMTIDTYYSACIGIYDTTVTQYTIKNSTLSSPSWGCVSFNKSNADFSAVNLTIENSTLVSYKSGGTQVLVCQSTTTPGTVTFGKNVDLYCYSTTYAKSGYTAYAGKTLTKQTETVTVTAGGANYAGMNHWSTADYAYLVGFGRTDITPTQSVPLAGYGNTGNRMSASNYTNLYVTATAVTNRDGESVMFLSVDLIKANSVYTKEIRNGIHAATGIDPNRIMINYSHSHSSPDLTNASTTTSGWVDETGGYRAEYINTIISQAIAAGTAAWNDRQAAEMYTGSITAPGLNFVRHYQRTDGTFFGPGFGTRTTNSSLIQTNNGYGGHAGNADSQLGLIRFTRPGGDDILLMNWQAHATMNSYDQSTTDRARLSADFVEGIRNYVEGTLNMKFSYFQGAAGDLMPTSDVTSENPTYDIYTYGGVGTSSKLMLGYYINTCLSSNMTKIAAGPIRSEAFIFYGDVNKAGTDLYSFEELYELAVEYQTLSTSTEKTTFRKKYGFINDYHVSSVRRCYGLGDYIPERCSVLSIGSVGFAAAPHELFSDTGKAIKTDSLFASTFVLSYSNDHNGYLPTERSYEYPGYKMTDGVNYSYGSYEVGCTSFAKGTAEKLAEAFAKQWTAIYPEM